MNLAECSEQKLPYFHGNADATHVQMVERPGKTTATVRLRPSVPFEWAVRGAV